LEIIAIGVIVSIGAIRSVYQIIAGKGKARCFERSFCNSKDIDGIL